MLYSLYLVFGVLPSIIWLLFFLREDAHPESNRMILKVFFYGIIAAFIAVIFEFGFLELSLRISLTPIVILILNIFIGVALVEEFSKYIVVKKIAIVDPELDEPLDVMLYMVIAGLGFAALENIFVLLDLGLPFNISNTISLTLLRFLGATFLHALCSGTIGFFLALSLFKAKNKLKLIITGLVIAAFLHGLFNFSIIRFEGSLKIVIPGIILGGSGIFVLLAFRKLKTLASICKLK